MAFPSSPSDGQIYKNYKYNSTKGAWIYSPYINYDASGNVIITPESGERIVFDDQSEDSAGTLHPVQLVDLYEANPTEGTDIAVNCSSYVPEGAKAVNLTCYYMRSSGNMIINFGKTIPISTTYTDIIVDYFSTNYVAQKVITAVDSNRKFYFKVSSGVCAYIYIKLFGYWI